MRRSSASLLLTFGLAVAMPATVAAQDAPEGPGASTPPSGPVFVTGEEFCGGSGPEVSEEAGLTIVRNVEFSCYIDLGDTRVTGMADGIYNDACISGNDCIYWGTYVIHGPDGDWEGTWQGAADPTVDQKGFVVALRGTDAYEGWSFLAHWLEPWSSPPATVSGLIYEGPLPPWEPPAE